MLNRGWSKGNKSTNPHSIYMRIRGLQARVATEIELYFEARNWPPIEQWTLNELVNGAPQDPVTGAYQRGRRATWLQQTIDAEIKRRMADSVRREMAKYLPGAIQVVGEMASPDSDVDPNIKLAAAKLLIDHVIGKPTVRVEASADRGPMDFLADAIVGPDGEDLSGQARRVIDGEVGE